jgi:hypothetical protein
VKKRWQYTWTDLEESSTWTVDEIDVPYGYTCLIDQSDGGYTITNQSELVPLAAPQTGMLQWPIPVLLAAGVLLIYRGTAAESKKKHAK